LFGFYRKKTVKPKKAFIFLSFTLFFVTANLMTTKIKLTKQKQIKVNLKLNFTAKPLKAIKCPPLTVGQEISKVAIMKK
jgi:hypothetical protein